MIYDEAKRAARELDNEIDKLAAQLIREKGLPLWEALAEARRRIAAKRQGKPYIIPLTSNHNY